MLLNSVDDGVCLQSDQVFEAIQTNGDAINQKQHAQNAGVEKSWKIHVPVFAVSLFIFGSSAIPAEIKYALF